MTAEKTLLGFAAENADALADAYPSRLISEPGVVQDLRSIYVETHFAQLLILLALMEGKGDDRLLLADRRLALWEPLQASETFCNFGNSLSLVLLRAAGAEASPVGQRLLRLCRGQTLSAARVEASKSGNNIYLMSVVNEQLMRPLALGESPEKGWEDRTLAEFARWRSADGIHSDWPRRTSGARIYPPVYALKVAYLLGLAFAISGKQALRTAFLAAIRPLTAVMTRDGSISFFGRSDNTTFASGLALFCLRLAGATSEDPAETALLASLWRRQASSYMARPRTTGGWLQVNHYRGGAAPRDYLLSRDQYAYTTEYCVASLCYLLLGLRLSPAAASAQRPKPNPPASEVVANATLGVVRLRNAEAELVIRTTGDLVEGDRRYLGPTCLRLSFGEDLPIGAIPRNCAPDFRAQPQSVEGVGLLLKRWRHFLEKGIDEFQIDRVGFIPFFRDRRKIIYPGRLLASEAKDGMWRGTYAFVALEPRSLRYPLRELADFVRKNCGLPARTPPAPAIREPGSPSRAFDEVRLHREVRLERTRALLVDRIVGGAALGPVRFSTRSLSGAQIEVSGLAQDGAFRGWSSDGETEFRSYQGAARQSDIEYRVVCRSSEEAAVESACSGKHG